MKILLFIEYLHIYLLHLKLFCESFRIKWKVKEPVFSKQIELWNPVLPSETNWGNKTAACKKCIAVGVRSALGCGVIFINNMTLDQCKTQGSISNMKELVSHSCNGKLDWVITIEWSVCCWRNLKGSPKCLESNGIRNAKTTCEAQPRFVSVCDCI